MTRISDNLRQQVTERALGRCEYCQTQQAIVVAMEIDHIIPESAGGETQPDNLALACIGCNGYKLDFQIGIDPDTQHEFPFTHEP
jgi:5-methylcytosine-specific restriction endonuclease McrA